MPTRACSIRWGSNPSAEEIADIRLIPRQWLAAHVLGYIVIMASGVELWNFPLGRVWNESGVWNTTGGAATIAVE